MSPVTTSLSELIEQLDTLINAYKPHQLNYSDGTRGYVNGLKEARHLAQNLLNKELWEPKFMISATLFESLS